MQKRLFFNLFTAERVKKVRDFQKVRIIVSIGGALVINSSCDAC